MPDALDSYKNFFYEFTMQKRASDQLISENRELNSYKRSVLILEQEKRELETKINTYRESSPGRFYINIRDYPCWGKGEGRRTL